MMIKQTLASIVLAGVVAFGSAGCENEKVTVEKYSNNSAGRRENREILTITRADGAFIKYEYKMTSTYK